jgi:RNAse (barnase) inhibitor barstar
MNQPQMVPMNQQPMQQPQMMTPQMMQHYQQQMLMNQQAMQQPQMMQPGMMQPQYMQQPMMQPGMMQPGMVPQQPQQAVVNTTRFTQSSPTMPQQFTPNNEGNRYQQPMAQEVVTADESTVPIPYSVKPIVHKFITNEKVKLNTITSEVKESNVKYVQTHIAVDCVQEVIESIIETAYLEETNNLITAHNFIVTHNHYRVDLNEKFATLYNGDIKTAYKLMKVYYKEATDKYQIAALDDLDNILTDRINDFITISSNDSISIDSFTTDFNDLLKVLRNTEEDLEDKVLDYMDEYLNQMKQLTDTVETSISITCINEPIQVAYIDKHVVETGLENVTTRFIKLDETASNVFLNSLGLTVCAKLNTRDFLLVTLDRTVFKCMVDDDSNLFIRISQ